MAVFTMTGLSAVMRGENVIIRMKNNHTFHDISVFKVEICVFRLSICIFRLKIYISSLEIKHMGRYVCLYLAEKGKPHEENLSSS